MENLSFLCTADRLPMVGGVFLRFNMGPGVHSHLAGLQPLQALGLQGTKVLGSEIDYSAKKNIKPVTVMLCFREKKMILYI